MASIRRERLFEEYRNRRIHADTLFKRALWAMLIPFGGLLAALTLYYFIRGLALLAGASMVVGQLLANSITGRNDPIPLTYKVPYMLMFYLFLVTVFAIITRSFKKKWSNFTLKIIFIVSFIYGFISIYFNLMRLSYCIILMIASFYGFWCCDVISRQFKEHEFLAKQEGYPDFIDLVGEPVPISNTRGIYMRQYEKLKEQAQQRTKNKLASDDSDSCVDVSQYLTKSGEGNIPDNAMDELTTNFSQSIDELLKKAK